MNAAEFLHPEGWLKKDGGPRYVQLQRRLEEGIRSGALPPNSSLPPEREIAGITGLSRVTVRKAIQELVRVGLIDQRQGSGSFVRAPMARLEQSLSHLTSFSQEMAKRGMDTRSKWLERGVFIPTDDEVAALGLAVGEQVARISRLREAGGRPMALERASLPVSILPNPVEVTASLYDVLDRHGHRPVQALQKISAVNLEPPEAELLGTSAGMAGLKIERKSFLPDGTVVELTRSIFRGDAYDFVAELRLQV